MNRLYTEFVKTRYTLGCWIRRWWKQIGNRNSEQIKLNTLNESARVVEELIIAAGGEEEVYYYYNS